MIQARIRIRDFANTVQMEMAIRDIRRYQAAYLAANSKTILVRWKKGWFATGEGTFAPQFVRPTEFRNMTDRLEARVKKESRRR